MTFICTFQNDIFEKTLCQWILMRKRVALFYKVLDLPSYSFQKKIPPILFHKNCSKDRLGQLKQSYLRDSLPKWTDNLAVLKNARIELIQMSRPLSEAFKSSQSSSKKVLAQSGSKTTGIKKKSSGVITPGNREVLFRPKSSVTDVSHKEALHPSTGMTSCQSNKMFQSTKLSPKVSFGDIKQFISQPKRRTGNSNSKEKRKRKQEVKNYESKKESKVKEEIKRSLANVINVYYPEQKHSPLDVSLTGPSELDSLDKQEGLSRTDFHFLEVVGKGGYGKVWKVEYRKTHKLFAMKEMSKAVIIMKKSVEGVQNQRKLLSKLSHPFVANMIGAFHDRQNLYLVIDLMPGGDLRYHIGEHKCFTQEQTRFFVACIIIALEYLHDRKIIHRDIKPQNLVLDANGYVRITDFGIARTQRDANDKDTSGTPGYMAPEVMCKQAHSYTVDYFALGVIAYEFMMGKRPYTGKSRNQIREAILAKQVQIKKSEVPAGWSLEAVDFVNRLIQRQPRLRLGGKQGISELKEHPWLKRYAWKKLATKQLKAPFLPFQNHYVSSQESQQYNESLMQYKILERLDDHKDLFVDYTHKMAEG